MKDHFWQWLINDKTLIAVLFMAVLITWFFTKDKELFRLMDMILSALFGWGAGKVSIPQQSTSTTTSTSSSANLMPVETKEEQK